MEHDPTEHEKDALKSLFDRGLISASQYQSALDNLAPTTQTDNRVTPLTPPPYPQLNASSRAGWKTFTVVVLCVLTLGAIAGVVITSQVNRSNREAAADKAAADKVAADKAAADQRALALENQACREESVLNYAWVLYLDVANEVNYADASGLSQARSMAVLESAATDRFFANVKQLLHPKVANRRDDLLDVLRQKQDNLSILATAQSWSIFNERVIVMNQSTNDLNEATSDVFRILNEECTS